MKDVGAEPWIGGVDVTTGQARWGAAAPVLADLVQARADYGSAGPHHSVDGLAKGLQVADLPHAM